MKYEFKPSFDRSVKSPPLKKKQQIKDLCIDLIDILCRDKELSSGMGLTVKYFYEKNEKIR